MKMIDGDGDEIGTEDVGDLIDSFLSVRNLLFVYDEKGNKHLVCAKVTFEDIGEN